jgi:hypothetical protein
VHTEDQVTVALSAPVACNEMPWELPVGGLALSRGAWLVLLTTAALTGRSRGPPFADYAQSPIPEGPGNLQFARLSYTRSSAFARRSICNRMCRRTGQAAHSSE